MTPESSTLTITAASERLHLTGDGTVWLVWTFPLMDEDGIGDDFDTDSEPLGQIGSRKLWKAVPHQLLGELEDLEDEWERRPRGDERACWEAGFYLGLEVENWK